MFKRYRQMTWFVTALWYLFCLGTLDYNGPFLDEGIYITAGERTLEGHGLSDGYLGWFAGSLLWPALAGVGSKIGGLAGARALAASFAAIALVATARATANLFGEPAGFWTATALALNAPLLAVARMGVYDAMALSGIGISFWAITELYQRNHRLWLALATFSFMVGVFAKYPTGLMLLPLVVVIFVLRKEKALVDVAFFSLVSLALGLAYVLPVREWVAPFFAYRLTDSPVSGVSRAMVAADLWRLSALPLTLAIGGWLVVKDRRALASVLVACVLIWPAYHLILGDSVSRSKHVVLGFLFAYPLGGCLLAKLRQESALLSRLRTAAAISLIVIAGSVGAAQLIRFNRAWPDARPAVGYLSQHVQLGQKLLIGESWPYTMYLYHTGGIQSPWDIFDVYRITHGQSELDLCEYDWFVDSQGGSGWPTSVRENVLDCGTFYPVFTSTSEVENINQELDYVRYPVQITVWQNIERR
jgi:hypothetical protein